MHETIDRLVHHATGIGKHLQPFREGLVGRDQGALLLVPAVDQLEEQIGMPVRIG